MFMGVMFMGVMFMSIMTVMITMGVHSLAWLSHQQSLP
jgi:hypothetical protein